MSEFAKRTDSTELSCTLPCLTEPTRSFGVVVSDVPTRALLRRARNAYQTSTREVVTVAELSAGALVSAGDQRLLDTHRLVAKVRVRTAVNDSSYDEANKLTEEAYELFNEAQANCSGLVKCNTEKGFRSACGAAAMLQARLQSLVEQLVSEEMPDDVVGVRFSNNITE